MKVDGQPKLMGFYTTRFVEAETLEKAEDLAVQLVREDAKLREAVINEESDHPAIHAQEIVILQTFEGIELPGSGYTLYEEESQGKA
jgi:hypothetical protein